MDAPSFGSGAMNGPSVRNDALETALRAHRVIAFATWTTPCTDLELTR
jgi:hypothetical protein